MVFREVAYHSPEWFRAVELREDILRKPMGLSFSKEELNEEEHHFHIAGFVNGELIATAVMAPDKNAFKMQRVAVHEDHRGHHVGTSLVEFCELFARNHGVHSVFCHARDSAIEFYLKNLYRMEGDYFDEDGIPHVKMIKSLV